MKRIGWLGILLLLPGCAHLRGETPEVRLREELWQAAHVALAEQKFGRADTIFTELVRNHSVSEMGRESLFYIGALRLDPRNERFSAAASISALRQYLSVDTLETTQIHRGPEGRTLLEIAEQLTLPASERISAFRGETMIVTERVTTPAVAGPVDNSELTAEINRLRELLNLRDADNQRLRDELERIRRTLSPAARPQ